ncbi:hypothetical protein JCM11251_004774 [Rhodosporidiobolus azoricus]
MKLHWILHKGVCGRPTNACYYPPLSKDDLTMLRRAKDFPFIDAGYQKSPSFPAHLETIKLWEGDFEALLYQLSQPPDICHIPEPRRSFLLAYARNHLSRSLSADFCITTSRPGTFSFRSASVWRHLSLHVVGIIDDIYYRDSTARSSDWMMQGMNIFELANTYLRQVALLSALWTWSSPYPVPSALTNDLLDYALERKRKSIDEVDMPEEWKVWLWQQHESNVEMNAKVKTWMFAPENLP